MKTQPGLSLPRPGPADPSGKGTLFTFPATHRGRPTSFTFQMYCNCIEWLYVNYFYYYFYLSYCQETISPNSDSSTHFHCAWSSFSPCSELLLGPSVSQPDKRSRPVIQPSMSLSAPVHQPAPLSILGAWTQPAG